MSIGCEPSRTFHGRLTYNEVDYKPELTFKTIIVPTADFAAKLLRRTQILYDKTKKNVMQSYIRYKNNCDKKLQASPLQEKDYCYILQTKACHQGSKVPFRDFIWNSRYVVEKILPNENYISRKVNTKTPKFYIDSDFGNSLLIRFRLTITTMLKSDMTMLLLSLRMTSRLDCPTVYSDHEKSETTNSQNAVTQQTANVHPKSTKRHQTLSMTNHAPVSNKVKITQKLQKRLAQVD